MPRTSAQTHADRIHGTGRPLPKLLESGRMSKLSSTVAARPQAVNFLVLNRTRRSGAAAESHGANADSWDDKADECFLKKWENLKAALALHFAWYNFRRVHQTLRVSRPRNGGKGYGSRLEDRRTLRMTGAK